MRVIDFLLDDPDRDYTKTEIASGASVSRPTLYKIWNRLKALELLKSTRKFGRTELYRLNVESELVRSLLRFDNQLSKTMFNAAAPPDLAAITVASRSRRRA